MACCNRDIFKAMMTCTKFACNMRCSGRWVGRNGRANKDDLMNRSGQGEIISKVPQCPGPGGWQDVLVICFYWDNSLKWVIYGWRRPCMMNLSRHFIQ